MLCPKDMVQMHQYQNIGGGESGDDYYETWELKECPVCGCVYREFYSAEKLSNPKIPTLIKKQLQTIQSESEGA